MTHINQRVSRESGFSRIDLAVATGILAILAAGVWYQCTGERGRSAQCLGNMAAMGHAMADYAGDHGGDIPAAGVDIVGHRKTWDSQLFPYLRPGLAKQKGAYEERQLLQAVSPTFVCPSDFFPRGGHPRSYAMDVFSMVPDNWPAGRETPTGTGLWWDKQAVTALLKDGAAKAMEQPDSLPALKMSDLAAPADTLLLTEFIAPGNEVEGLGRARVHNVEEQRAAFTKTSPSVHAGRFDYLMADGHAEMLTALQTGAPDGTGGIWVIKKGD